MGPTAAAGRPRLVYGACAASLVIGLVFVFVRAPHPWGWEGIDGYHQIALDLARGHEFGTMEVPWGYAYFLAAFYRVFGDRPWIPLTVQAILNALIPLLVFDVARTWVDRRTAAVAALLTGLLSFNTVYASTQSSDAICTFLFMSGVLAFVRARDAGPTVLYAVAGLLMGIAAQFRPNLVLIPLLLAAFALADGGKRGSLPTPFSALLVIVSAAVALAPWVVRNYRLTRSILPTSVHGGVQLWYGTLQTGPYLNSRAYNPRSIFEGASFEYTSLLDVPIVIDADMTPCPGRPLRTALTYWTDRDRAPRRLVQATADRAFAAEIDAPRQPAAIYYYFDVECADGSRQIPAFGAAAPFVYFASDDHLHDLDRHGDLVDVFDIIRLIRYTAWSEAVPFADAFAAAGLEDIADAIDAVTPVGPAGRVPGPHPPPRVVVERDRARLLLADGSSIDVPRRWSGSITDTGFEGPLAQALLHASASVAELRLARAAGWPSPGPWREERTDIGVNRVFYRREPHLMRRYVTLAADNIRRDPGAFALASAYRALRMFVIVGTGDRHTAQQFDRSAIVYAVGMAASIVYAAAFAAGAAIAWRRRLALALPLALILYLPLTIAPVLTNMRYTVTVQPLIFMFIAIAATAVIDLRTRRAAAPAAAHRAGTRTASQP